jgi:hypothetical protein
MTTTLVIVFIVGFTCGIYVGSHRVLKALGRAEHKARYAAAKTGRRFGIW